MLTLEQLTMLRRPFARADHEFLRGFVYLTEEAITTRIEEVDPSWEFALLQIEHVGNQAVAHARMTIHGVFRDGVGMQLVNEKAGEAEKGAATDALKRCARLFGVGRYLLDAPKEEEFNAWLAQRQKEHGGKPGAPPPPPPAAQDKPSAAHAPTSPASVSAPGGVDPKPSALNGSTGGGSNGGSSAKAEFFPDEAEADGFKRYLVHEIIVNEMPNGGRQYVAKSEIGDNIVTYGGDKFSDVGYDTSIWQANGRPNKVSPACIVEAKLDGNRWIIRGVAVADA